MDTIQNTKAPADDASDAPIRQYKNRVRPTTCFSTTPPPMDFVLPGLKTGTVGGLVSPGGVGKSMLAMQIALDVATGSNLSGLSIHGRGPVLLMAGEDPEDVLHTRMHAMGAFLDPGHREVADDLYIESCVGEGVDLAIDSDLRGIERLATGHRLVIFDTLTRFHSLDENKAEDAKFVMSRLEGMAKRTGAAVLFLHHVSKAAALGGMADLQQAARGSSVFVDNARWLAFLATMGEDEAKGFGIDDDERHHWLRFNVSKQNYGRRKGDTWYEREANSGVLLPKSLEFISSLTAKKKGNRNGNL